MSEFEKRASGEGEEGEDDDDDDEDNTKKKKKNNTSTDTLKKKEEEEEEAMSEWSSAIDPESGDEYYYNTMTGATSWEKPKELKEGVSGGSGGGGSGGGGGGDGVEKEMDTGTTKREDGFEDGFERQEEEKEEDKADAPRDYTGKTGGIEAVSDKESTWEQIKEYLTKTPIIQDILGK